VLYCDISTLHVTPKQPKLTAIIKSRWITLFLAHCTHGWQRQNDPVSLPSSWLEKTTRSSLHQLAQHCPTGSETPPPYAPWSNRFGSEPPPVEDDVDIWRYTVLELHDRNDDDLTWPDLWPVELWLPEKWSRIRPGFSDWCGSGCCSIAPSLLWLRFFVSVSHFSEFHEKRPVLCCK